MSSLRKRKQILTAGLVQRDSESVSGQVRERASGRASGRFDESVLIPREICAFSVPYAAHMTLSCLTARTHAFNMRTLRVSMGIGSSALLCAWLSGCSSIIGTGAPLMQPRDSKPRLNDPMYAAAPLPKSQPSIRTSTSSATTATASAPTTTAAAATARR